MPISFACRHCGKSVKCQESLADVTTRLTPLRIAVALTLALLFSGCNAQPGGGQSYHDALNVYTQEVQELERLKEERKALTDQVEEFVSKVHAVDADSDGLLTAEQSAEQSRLSLDATGKIRASAMPKLQAIDQKISDQQIRVDEAFDIKERLR